MSKINHAISISYLYPNIYLYSNIKSCHADRFADHLRNDNGSQMESYLVQQYFADRVVVQEFNRPATPEQNAHIESYHSILERVICSRYEFEVLSDSMDLWVYEFIGLWI